MAATTVIGKRPTSEWNLRVARPDTAHEILWRDDIWNVSSFVEIEDIIGREKAEALLKAYIEKLDSVTDRLTRVKSSTLRTRRLAHDVKSISGQLGFRALSERSAQMMAANTSALNAEAMRSWVALIRASRDAAQFYVSRPGCPSC